MALARPSHVMLNDDSSTSKPSSPTGMRCDALLFYYVVFGALHETAHVVTAAFLHVLLFGRHHFDAFLRGFFADGFSVVMFRTIFARQSVVPLSLPLDVGASSDVALIETLIRHSGWMFSVIAAVTLAYYTYRHWTKLSTKPIAVAAIITAVEAVWTDLLRLPVIPLFGPTSQYHAGITTFFCGNFGLIVINSAWTSKDNGQHALDLLERMVNVTMMRGAQSGGVITYCRSKRLPVGVRSRVVNKKRTDLSKLIRAKVKRDVFDSLANSFPSDGFVPFFSGHTRFATSSKATFDGTHPQRWTPPTNRRFYNFGIVPDRTVAVDASTSTSFSPFSKSAPDKDFPRLVRTEIYVTHNGDFDFYEQNGKTCDLEVIQKWLPIATSAALPATVDSACIAGFIDLIRCQGCFSLSARYAVCLGLPTSKITEDPVAANLPSVNQYDKVASLFEKELDDMLSGGETLETISSDEHKRQVLAFKVTAKLLRESRELQFLFSRSSARHGDEELGGDGLRLFAKVAVDAFFDNDLLNSTKIFLGAASGSFGLCITSSLDAQRQLCLAARGQTLSIALYPKKGIICFGSEQAAVKVGMNAELPGGAPDVLGKTHLDIDNDDLRLDLDDLGGEIILLDWGKRRFKNPAVSPPNRGVVKHSLMNGRVDAYLLQESKVHNASGLLYHRMTRLTRNQFIKPLPEKTADPVLKDIQDIPLICREIQEDWRNMNKSKMSFNRLTAWNLARCIRKKMDSYVEGSAQSRSTDILLTGCEVSLWLAEQFACDLQKSFPKLNVTSVSSNKLLGLFGQEMSIPVVGYPMSNKTTKLDNAIVIIVSHSGGTFSPLAVSNLLNTNNNVFVVTSEWDSQIGKQLRAAHNEDDHMMLLFNSRVFTTDVGLRPAEPCSVSVAATQQLLTCIFQHIAIVILSNQRYRHTSGAIITEHDLRILERCNQDNLHALEEIVGLDYFGNKITKDQASAEQELRHAGRVWADHILENARAYVITFVYIMATVISGYPIASAIAKGAGLVNSTAWYFVRLIDALIYFYLPQINVLIIRVIQRRAIRHRMVGRTVVIADIPWVAQAAEAFLSKIFAVSYSIAGLNVLSGNPADHFVHRHTHRVVRGTLIVCGRPDGRLSALTSLEASCCLSVNQASSIQSIGSTAESITIGHNPYKLPLSARGIFLDRHRPLFLCEKMLDQIDAESRRKRIRLDLSMGGQSTSRRKRQTAIVALEDHSEHKSNVLNDVLATSGVPTLVSKDINELWPSMKKSPSVTFDHAIQTIPEANVLSARKSVERQALQDKKVKASPVTPTKQARPTLNAAAEKRRSSTALLGAYTNLQKNAERCLDCSGHIPTQNLIESAIAERKWNDGLREIFERLDVNDDGALSRDEFVAGFHKLKPDLTKEQLMRIFDECDVDDNGSLSLAEFVHMMKLPRMDIAYMCEPSIRDETGVIQVRASEESFFGERVMQGAEQSQFAQNPALTGASKSQDFAQELYECRIASMQRFVAMAVMFHEMGRTVEGFFRKISCGLLSYRYDRTHSIMRIATTASPVSGADVRERMRVLQMLKKIHHSVHVISIAYIRYRKEKEKRHLSELEEIAQMRRSTTNDTDDTVSSEDSSH